MYEIQILAIIMINVINPSIKQQYELRSKNYQSNFELTSKEKVDSIGVIASSAVCPNIIMKKEKLV